MLIWDRDFYQSQIPEPTTATKEGKNLLSPSYVATKIHKIENYFNFKRVKKDI
jgi:hypothetical protein